jgi:hypothetical protein
MRRDRKAFVEAKQVAVAGHPSDGEDMKTSKSALEGHVSLVISEGEFCLLGASIYTHWMGGWQPTLGTLAHLFFHFGSPFSLGF